MGNPMERTPKSIGGLKRLGRISSFAAAFGAVAAGAHAQTPPVSGSSQVLAIDGNATTPQTILVVPVVDPSFAYSATSRTLEGSFPGKRADIVARYTRMGAYWKEASYGRLDIRAEIPTCFYQIKQMFPNAGEVPFQPVYVQSADRFYYPGNGVHYASLVVHYTLDPALPAKMVTFVSDPTIEYAVPDVLVQQLNSQLTAEQKDELQINFENSADAGTAPPSGGLARGHLTIKIKDEKVFPNSSLSIDMLGSDPQGRATMGFTLPKVSAGPMGHVLLTTDGAEMASRLPAPTDRFSFTFVSADGKDQTGALWNVTAPNGGALPACTNNCPTWSDAASLSLLLRPQAGHFGVIRPATSAAGRAEFQFETDVNNETVVPFSFSSTGNSTALSERLGLTSQVTTIGNQRGRTINTDSLVLTQDALRAFLITELGDNSACLTSELSNATIPTPGAGGYDTATAAVKATVDTYLRQFSAIHVFLMSQSAGSDVWLRENARYGNNALDMTLTSPPPGTGSMSYQVLSPIAAVNLESAASVIAHETGHLLGFPDLYDWSHDAGDPAPSEFNPNLTFPGNWDVMARQFRYPHPGAFIKERYHAWISEAAASDVTTVPPNTDITVVLTPEEASAANYVLAPQAFPVTKMLVLPLSPDLTPGSTLPRHFVAIENRQPQPGTVDTAFNTQLPFGGGLHVTDNIGDFNTNGADVKPISRNYSHTLTHPVGSGYPDEDGTPVHVGDGVYQASDTFPSYPGLTVEGMATISGPTPTSPPSIQVKVGFHTNQLFDLKIDPWLAPKGPYATPAIWFEPATSAAEPADIAEPTDPGNINAPVFAAGYDPAKNGGKPLNWIRVFVANSSDIDATNVVLKLSLNSPGGIGSPAQWVQLGLTNGKSIPAHGSAVFNFGWSPDDKIAANGHTCIAAEVYDWTAGAFGHLADVNPFNNLSQENVQKMVMVHGSPWHDIPFQVEVHNSFSRSVEVRLEPKGLSPGYAVALDERGAQMPGKSGHVFSGALHWDPTVIPVSINQDPADPFWQACNATAIAPLPVTAPQCGSTWSIEATAHVGDSWVPLGGVSYDTQSKPVATVTNQVTVNPINGNITISGGVSPPTKNQTIRIIIVYPSGRQDIKEVTTNSGGTFTLTVPPAEPGSVSIQTVLPAGDQPFAPSTQNPIVVGDPSSFINMQGNGDLRFSITYPNKQSKVYLFALKNNLSQVAENIVSSEVHNADGTYTYQKIVAASQYQNGDVIRARFYAFEPNGPGIYMPGPDERLWLPNYTYSHGFACPAPPIGSCQSNLLTPVTATASSLENGSWVAANAIDRDFSTRWSSAFSDPQWLVIDLGKTVQIHRALLYWEDAFSTDYDVQVSADSTHWTTVYSNAHADGAVDDLPGLNAQGRYVRIYSRHRGLSQYGNSLWEVLLFGDESPTCSTQAPIVRACVPPDPVRIGNVRYEKWLNVSGTSVSQVPVSTPPDFIQDRTTFESLHNISDNYGVRMRGWLTPPTTGNYTFWVAGDDSVALYLSTTTSPGQKALIASSTSYTGFRQWTKAASQKSSPVSLVKGRWYYIEALMKEASGDDHLSVGWLKPGQTGTEPSEIVPGAQLEPYRVNPDLQLLINSRYEVRNVNSDKCVDVAGGSSADGANVDQVQCNATGAQRFDLVNRGDNTYRLVNLISKKCVHVASNSAASGANVEQRECDGFTSNLWTLTSIGGNQFRATSVKSGKCLDVAGSSTQSGANIQQFDCNSTSAQAFRFLLQ